MANKSDRKKSCLLWIWLHGEATNQFPAWNGANDGDTMGWRMWYYWEVYRRKWMGSEIGYMIVILFIYLFIILFILFFLFFILFIYLVILLIANRWYIIGREIYIYIVIFLFPVTVTTIRGSIFCTKEATKKHDLDHHFLHEGGHQKARFFARRRPPKSTI